MRNQHYQYTIHVHYRCTTSPASSHDSAPHTPQAPNYSKVVSTPMSFSQIRANISSGKYQTWNDMQDDLELMCHNALTYNPPGSVFYKEASNMNQVQ